MISRFLAHCSPAFYYSPLTKHQTKWSATFCHQNFFSKGIQTRKAISCVELSRGESGWRYMGDTRLSFQCKMTAHSSNHTKKNVNSSSAFWVEAAHPAHRPLSILFESAIWPLGKFDVDVSILMQCAPRPSLSLASSIAIYMGDMYMYSIFHRPCPLPIL